MAAAVRNEAVPSAASSTATVGALGAAAAGTKAQDGATAEAATATKGDRLGARERLLDAAGRLFYAEGVHTVGIDRIIDEAGVAKASLYKTFGSKEALIQAYLRDRHDRTARRTAAAVARVDDPREKILAVFDAQAQTVAQPGYRGCAFVAASAEAPAGGAIDDASRAFRTWLRSTLVELARAAGAPDPEALARTLHALYDGVSVSVRMDHDPSITADIRPVVAMVVDAALAG
jgi:AcrR family transcriptional regulator